MSKEVYWNPTDVQTLIDRVREDRAHRRKVNWKIFKEIFPNRTQKACRTIWDKHKNNPKYIQREEK